MIQSSDADAASETAASPAQARAVDAPEDRDDGRWWLVPVLLLAGFVLLLWQVKAHGPVTGLDIRVRDRIQDWAGSPSTGWLAVPGRDLADLGNQPIALLVLFAATAVAIRVTRSWWPVWVMLAAGAALLTVIPLKLWIGRPGPGQVARRRGLVPVPGEDEVEAGDLRVGTVDHRDADRDPPGCPVAGVQRGDLLAADRPADEDQVAVPLRPGIFQPEPARPEHRAPSGVEVNAG